jgi:purine nucleosidase
MVSLGNSTIDPRRTMDDFMTDFMAGGRRTIVDTDAKNEADDQYAIVHALLSPSLDIRGIVPAHFGSTGSQPESREEVDLLLRLMNLSKSVVVADGAHHALPDARTPVDSPGAQLIIEQARAETSPLLVAFLGPLTDMASAILLAPDIVNERIGVVWIGGPPYGEIDANYGPESNTVHDLHAANVVFSSGIRIWQIPMDVYQQTNVSHSELRLRVEPQGEIGRYLFRQLIEYAETTFPYPMESHALGDSPAIAAMINPMGVRWRWQTPVQFTANCTYRPSDVGASIKVATSIDVRFMMEDFFAKLHSFAM